MSNQRTTNRHIHFRQIKRCPSVCWSSSYVKIVMCCVRRWSKCGFSNIHKTFEYISVTESARKKAIEAAKYMYNI